MLESSLALAGASLAVGTPGARAAGTTDISPLCDATCQSALDSAERTRLPSGLEYQDITLGKGPSPPVGFQVVCHYVAMTPTGRIFQSSLEKGTPFDLRVGAGQVIPGLDEGLLTMKVGGVRRLYIPGSLAFPKGLKAAAGRPSVPPNSPVMFDVQLLYIPGLDDEE